MKLSVITKIVRKKLILQPVAVSYVIHFEIIFLPFCEILEINIDISSHKKTLVSYKLNLILKKDFYLFLTIYFFIHVAVFSPFFLMYECYICATQVTIPD